MKIRIRLAPLSGTVAVLMALAGCASQKEALNSLAISPATGTATHGSTGDTVQFTATGNFGQYTNSVATSGSATLACMTSTSDTSRTLNNAIWSTSDPVNTSISASGLATCVGMTGAPATITAFASGICGGEKATATLNCN
jgi:hypothetical protein